MHKPFRSLSHLFVNENGDLENLHASKSFRAQQVRKRRAKERQERQTWFAAKKGNHKAIKTLIRTHGLTPEIEQLRNKAQNS